MLLLDEPFGKLDSLTRMELQDVLLGLLAKNRVPTLMVTHDVDEALLLSDRIVMMTNGPEARVGETLATPFARPRVRVDVLAHHSYYGGYDVINRILPQNVWWKANGKWKHLWSKRN
jgi:ABC-type nitrate/sulfonate/bicarbonate transport system ATPase subunit